MASLYERSNGIFDADFYPEGERTRFSLRTKPATLDRLAELERAFDEGQFDPFNFEAIRSTTKTRTALCLPRRSSNT